MSKILITLAFVLLSLDASAQSDYSIDFGIDETDDRDLVLVGAELDFKLGTRFIQTNGLIRFSDGSSSSTSGSCHVTTETIAQEEVPILYCEMSFITDAWGFLLNLNDVTGTVAIYVDREDGTEFIPLGTIWSLGDVSK